MLLRDKLKEATRDAHEALEARLALARGDISIERYVCYLHDLLAFYRPLSERLTAAGRAAPLSAHCESRVAWLEDDLAYFGTEDRGDDPSINFLPTVTAACEVLGVSYVMEGAALGARALYASFHARWGIGRHRGGSFLFGHGPETGRRWRAFVAALNAVELDGQEESRCIAAACQTFAGLTAWFAHRHWPAQCVAIRGVSPAGRELFASHES